MCSLAVSGPDRLGGRFMAASPWQQASLCCWELIGRERALIKKRCEASPACWLWLEPVNGAGQPELFTEPITLEVQIIHSNAHRIRLRCCLCQGRSKTRPLWRSKSRPVDKC